MKAKVCVVVVAVAGAMFLPWQSPGQILYSTDFNSATPGLTGPTTFGGYGAVNNVGGTGWQIQGGSDGSPGLAVTTGINNTGVGGSQGLYADWDQSTASTFTYNQETIYGGIAAPGAGYSIGNIQVTLDIYVSGSSTTTPLSIAIQNTTNEFNFTPQLTDGSFTHVVFTGDQATSSGGAFNPTVSSNLRIQFGAGNGFGFDSGNIVVLDNILVQTVPEPTSLAVMGLGATVLMVYRRRRLQRT